MSQSNLTSRVGAFVVVCLVVVGVLMLAFSKGSGLFTKTYEIRMRLRTVGGLKERSAVLLAGVQVGNLKAVELAPDGRSVLLRLRIQQKYPVHGDAEFAVETVGVLGDQFVCIYPQKNEKPVLQDGDQVEGRESFNLQDMARSAGGLISELNLTLNEVRGAITNIKHGVLDPQTLSNLSATVANFRRVSEHSVTVVENVSILVRSNGLPLTQAITNMVQFSDWLQKVALHLDETILTNQASLHGAITNFEGAAASIKVLVAGLEEGRGVAGSLLRDELLRAQMAATINNLLMLSSNLNQYGLLYKPKAVRPASATSPGFTPGKKLF
jgi:phospholipid/cholesterol/gamma-HCH transport system substrate-binding protein